MRIDFNSSRVITCPFCSEKKFLTDYLSWNDIGAQYWSDNKCDGPMMPSSSNVQKCSRCGKYYLKSRQPERYEERFPSSSEKPLTYQQLKEAFVQFSAEGFGKEEEETGVRFMLHHAYNDYYYREGKRPASEGERQFFHDNALWLIEHVLKEDLMKAEFYREIGEFETAQKILDTVEISGKFREEIAARIQSRINDRDCAVFLLPRR